MLFIFFEPRGVWAVQASSCTAHPKDFSFGKSCGMIGLKSIEADLQAGKSPAEIEKAWQPDLEAFLAARKRHLLY